MNHLLPLLQGLKEATVADIGSGPHALSECTFANGIKLTIYPMDHREWPGIAKQDMEQLIYPEGFFDVAQCVNALDHTKNAEKALKEIIRVASKAVYIDCALYQKSTSGGWHYWDAQEDGTFTNGKESFSLKDYGFKIKNINFQGAVRYNHIIATLVK